MATQRVAAEVEVEVEAEVEATAEAEAEAVAELEAERGGTHQSHAWLTPWLRSISGAV